MKILITGMAGFIGRHLAQSLLADGDVVFGTILNSRENALLPSSLRDIPIRIVDVCDRAEVEAIVKSTQPDCIYHLAGQAYVIPSYRDVEHTFKVNVFGTIYLLESVRHFCQQASVAMACSGAEYGWPKALPIREDHVLEPLSPYGVSKVAQDLLAFQYHANYDIKTYRLRLFGTTGQGKTDDAPNDFASQIAMAERNGGHGIVRVGNLSRYRDISDVRDVVQAMKKVVELGEPGEAYNIGSGTPVQMKRVLEQLLMLSTADVKVQSDPSRIRLSDEQTLFADVTKVRKLGWDPQFSLAQTLYDVLEFWRRNLEPIPQPEITG